MPERSIVTTVEDLKARYAAGERDFRNARLEGVDFQGVVLEGVDLSGADLHRARFDNARDRQLQFLGCLDECGFGDRRTYAGLPVSRHVHGWNEFHPGQS